MKLGSTARENLKVGAIRNVHREADRNREDCEEVLVLYFEDREEVLVPHLSLLKKDKYAWHSLNDIIYYQEICMAQCMIVTDSK